MQTVVTFSLVATWIFGGSGIHPGFVGETHSAVVDINGLAPSAEILEHALTSPAASEEGYVGETHSTVAVDVNGPAPSAEVLEHALTWPGETRSTVTVNIDGPAPSSEPLEHAITSPAASEEGEEHKPTDVASSKKIPYTQGIPRHRPVTTKAELAELTMPVPTLHAESSYAETEQAVQPLIQAMTPLMPGGMTPAARPAYIPYKPSVLAPPPFSQPPDTVALTELPVTEVPPTKAMGDSLLENNAQGNTPAGYDSLGVATMCGGPNWNGVIWPIKEPGADTVNDCAKKCSARTGCTAFHLDSNNMCVLFGHSVVKRVDRRPSSKRCYKKKSRANWIGDPDAQYLQNLNTLDARYLQNLNKFQSLCHAQADPYKVLKKRHATKEKAWKNKWRAERKAATRIQAAWRGRAQKVTRTCDDRPTRQMIRQDITCEMGRLFDTRIECRPLEMHCNRDKEWKEEKYCQQSCFNLARGYDGVVCKKEHFDQKKDDDRFCKPAVQANLPTSCRISGSTAFLGQHQRECLNNLKDLRQKVRERHPHKGRNNDPLMSHLRDPHGLDHQHKQELTPEELHRFRAEQAWSRTDEYKRQQIQEEDNLHISRWFCALLGEHDTRQDTEGQRLQQETSFEWSAQKARGKAQPDTDFQCFAMDGTKSTKKNEYLQRCFTIGEPVVDRLEYSEFGLGRVIGFSKDVQKNQVEVQFCCPPQSVFLEYYNVDTEAKAMWVQTFEAFPTQSMRDDKERFNLSEVAARESVIAENLIKGPMDARTNCHDTQVHITSHRGKRLHLQSAEGIVGLSTWVGPSVEWIISDAGDGKVFIQNTRENKYLQDSDGTVKVHTNDDSWVKWTLVDANNGKVLIKSHRDALLQDDSGKVRVKMQFAPETQWVLTLATGEPCPASITSPKKVTFTLKVGAGGAVGSNLSTKASCASFKCTWKQPFNKKGKDVKCPGDASTCNADHCCKAETRCFEVEMAGLTRKTCFTIGESVGWPLSDGVRDGFVKGFADNGGHPVRSGGPDAAEVQVQIFYYAPSREAVFSLLPAELCAQEGLTSGSPYRFRKKKGQKVCAGTMT